MSRYDYNMSRDYYKILGVSINATNKELIAARRRMAFKYHPDRNKAPDALERFLEIQEAYDLLSNWEKRWDYDRARIARLEALRLQIAQQLRRHENCGEERWTVADELPSSGSDDTVEIEPGMYGIRLSLEQLFSGCQVTVEVPACSSSREDGRGATMTLDVDVCCGYRHGETITYSKWGNRGPWWLADPIKVVVLQKPHEVFERQNEDLVFKYTLLESQAKAGCTIHVPLIEGGSMPLTLAAGHVKPGTVVFIEGKGMPGLCYPSPRGRLQVQFDVVSQPARFRALRLIATLLATAGSLAALAYQYFYK